MADAPIFTLTEDVPALFRLYIVRSAEAMLARLEQVSCLLLEDRDQALHALRFALYLEAAWPFARDLLLHLAPPMEQAGFRDEWIGYLDEGIRQGRAQGDDDAVAELRLHLGILYQHQARFCEARGQFEAAACHFAQVGNAQREARALNRLAYVARCDGSLDEAREWVGAALRLGSGVTEEEAYSYLVLGTIAYDRREWQESHARFTQSLVLWEATGDERMIALGLTNLGTVLRPLERYDEAVECYERAIRLFEKVQDPTHQAFAMMNLGNIHLSLGHHEAALHCYEQAEPVFRLLQDQLRLAMVNNNLGMAYQGLHRLKEAERVYQTSIAAWWALGNTSALINVMDNLGLVYLELGLYVKAGAVWEEANDLLVQVQDRSTYDHLRAMVSRHLAEVANRRRAQGSRRKAEPILPPSPRPSTLP